MNRLFNRTTSLTLLAAVLMVGCGGTKMLKDPEPLALTGSLASASDSNIDATLDWVVVRDGPGTWAKNADWDQYLLRIGNRSGGPIRISGIAVYDSLDFRQETNGDRKSLVKASRDTSKRYKDEGVKVKAGVGGGVLVAAGVATYSASAAVAAASLYGGSTAAAGAAGAAVAGVFLTPVLITGGFVRAARTSRVGKEIALRQVDLPVEIEPGSTQQFAAFFPLTPSPKMLELSYIDASGEHQLTIDTSELLQGLHMDNRGASESRSL